MKTLELNQMENLEGGCLSCFKNAPDCVTEGNSFMVGALAGGAIAGGLLGAAIGGVVGLVGGTYLNMVNC